MNDKKKDVDTFFKGYYSVNAEIAEIENKLHLFQENESVWAELLNKKSVLMRESFSLNEEIINKEIRPKLGHPELIDKKFADEYVSECASCCTGKDNDYLLMDDMLETVLQFYLQYDNEPERIIETSGVLSFSQSKYFYSKKEKRSAEVADYALQYLPNFESYPYKIQYSLIAMAFNSFYAKSVYPNMLRTYDSIGLKKNLEEFKERSKIFLSTKNASLIPIIESTQINARITCIDVILTSKKRISYDHRLSSPSKEEKDIMDGLINECYLFLDSKVDKNNLENTLLISSHYLYCLYYLKKMSLEDYFSALKALYVKRNLQEIHSKDGFYSTDLMIYEMTIGIDLAYCIHLLYGNEKNAQREINKIFSEAISMLSSFTQKGSNYDMLQATSDYLNDMLPIVDGDSEVIKELDQLLFYKQTSTAIHSRMVTIISLLIAGEAFRKDPLYFSNTPLYDKAKSREENMAAVLSYIKNAGLLHDIGKTPFWDVINMQKRRITPSEFEVIKLHPRVGYEMLITNAKLSKYADVALLHHLYFDGSQGYPKGFDINKSSYKPFVDIVTVADSLDAATDLLGRNYTSGKSFDVVLNELVSQSGTRYSPYIVSLIKGNTNLKCRLKELLGEGRKDVYREVYMRFVDRDTYLK